MGSKLGRTTYVVPGIDFCIFASGVSSATNHYEWQEQQQPRVTNANNTNNILFIEDGTEDVDESSRCSEAISLYCVLLLFACCLCCIKS